MYTLRTLLFLALCSVVLKNISARKDELTAEACVRHGDSLLYQLDVEGARAWYGKAITRSREGTSQKLYCKYYYTYTYI